MRWHDVLRAAAAEVAADPVIQGIYGDAVRMSGDNDFLSPGVGYRLITDSVSELWEPCMVQWDQWAETVTDLALGEVALRTLFDRDGPVAIGGVYMWSVFTDGAELGRATSGMGPDRSGLFGRAVRFRHVPIRQALRPGRST